jgi:hypothetical protein
MLPLCSPCRCRPTSGFQARSARHSGFFPEIIQLSRYLKRRFKFQCHQVRNLSTIRIIRKCQFNFDFIPLQIHGKRDLKKFK